PRRPSFEGPADSGRAGRNGTCALCLRVCFMDAGLPTRLRGATRHAWNIGFRVHFAPPSWRRGRGRCCRAGQGLPGCRAARAHEGVHKRRSPLAFDAGGLRKAARGGPGARARSLLLEHQLQLEGLRLAGRLEAPLVQRLGGGFGEDLRLGRRGLDDGHLGDRALAVDRQAGLQHAVGDALAHGLAGEVRRDLLDDLGRGGVGARRGRDRAERRAQRQGREAEEEGGSGALHVSAPEGTGAMEGGGTQAAAASTGMRKNSTTETSRFALDLSDSVVAASSSTSAAFCCVLWSSTLTRSLMDTMPCAWCWPALDTSSMSWRTPTTSATTPRMRSPTSATVRAPTATLSAESSMSALISLAAVAERCASERTSAATTAKPRPCSAARAASTAALSARMLVWNAIASMTEMMSLMRALESEMSDIVFTRPSTDSPPCSTAARALAATSAACLDFSLLSATVTAMSSMALAVCCRLEEASSVREDRSALPCAISSELVATSRAVRCTSWITRVRCACMSPMARSSSPNSSLRAARIWCERSPFLMRSAACTASRSGVAMERVMANPAMAATARPRAPRPSITAELLLAARRPSAARAVARSRTAALRPCSALS